MQYAQIHMQHIYIPIYMQDITTHVCICHNSPACIEVSSQYVTRKGLKVLKFLQWECNGILGFVVSNPSVWSLTIFFLSSCKLEQGMGGWGGQKGGMMQGTVTLKGSSATHWSSRAYRQVSKGRLELSRSCCSPLSGNRMVNGRISFHFFFGVVHCNLSQCGVVFSSYMLSALIARKQQADRLFKYAQDKSLGCVFCFSSGCHTALFLGGWG